MLGKTLNTKNTKVDLNKWKGTPCTQIERLNIIKVFPFLKSMYKFNSVFMKTASDLFQNQTN